MSQTTDDLRRLLGPVGRIFMTGVHPAVRWCIRNPVLAWSRVAQILIGLFFLAAAYHKIETFFGAAPITLEKDFHDWLTFGYPLAPYGFLMKVVLPYAAILSWMVIVIQGVAGIMLVAHYRVRIAGWLLLFLHCNIFLATFHSLDFNVFVAVALWMNVFYVLMPVNSRRTWTMLTYGLCVISLAQLYIRLSTGDPLAIAFDWQWRHYVSDVLGISPTLKQWFIALTRLPFGFHIWVFGWWLQLVLTLGLLSKYRVYAGASLIILFLVRSILWMNVTTSTVAMWVLAAFAWTAYELYYQKQVNATVETLFP